MKSKFPKTKFFVSVLAFCLIFALTAGPVTWVLARKSLKGPWDMSNKIGGFYNEPQNEFSVMFFGSSHMYASLSPLELWKQTGVKSYVFATQLQPMWATYTYIKEALKTQSPELVVVECNMMGGDQAYYDDGVNFSFMDDLRPSWDKAKLAFVSAPKGERFPLMWNLVKYHGRWSELEDEDYDVKPSDLHDPLRGHVLLPDTQVKVPEVLAPKEGETGALLGKNVEWLHRIIDLCRAEGVELWLIKAPSNTALETIQAQRMEAVGELAREAGVPFDDFNGSYEAIGLADGDFYDQRHLTGSGAVKFTDYLGALLEERYPDLPRVPEDPAWDKDWQNMTEQRGK